MKVRFLESVTVPATKFGPELHFKKGSIHDLSEPSAYRWVRRNKAVYVVEEAVPKLKVGRPMMGEKKRGRPKKGAEAANPPKKDPGKVLGVTQRNIGPALTVTGGGIWKDV